MESSATERQNHSGSHPEWLKTATEHGENLSFTEEKINRQCSSTSQCSACICLEINSLRLLTTPLEDELTRLLRKTDRLGDCRVKQQVTDCVNFLLIETSRFDQGRWEP